MPQPDHEQLDGTRVRRRLVRGSWLLLGSWADSIKRGVFHELQILGLDETSQQRQQRCAIDPTRCLQGHAHRLDGTDQNRFREILADRLNHRTDVGLDKPHSDAVVSKSHGRGVLRSHWMPAEREDDHHPRRPPPPSAALRRRQFFHGSRISSTQVVSIPAITTRPLAIFLICRPATTSPTRTTRDPSIPGSPSMTADGSLPFTTPTTVSVGFGGWGANCSGSRSGSYAGSRGRRPIRNGSRDTTAATDSAAMRPPELPTCAPVSEAAA